MNTNGIERNAHNRRVRIISHTDGAQARRYAVQVFGPAEHPMVKNTQTVDVWVSVCHGLNIKMARKLSNNLAALLPLC